MPLFKKHSSSTLFVVVAVVRFICKREDSYSRILLFVHGSHGWWKLRVSGITRAVDENGSSCGTTPLRIQTVGFYVVYLGGKMKLRRNFILFFFFFFLRETRRCGKYWSSCRINFALYIETQARRKYRYLDRWYWFLFIIDEREKRIILLNWGTWSFRK